jgi:hypothetical protein
MTKMGGLFKSPKQVVAPLPTPPAPTPAPTIDVARAAQQTQDAVIDRRGRAASVLTSQQGDLTPVETGTKKLLGA